MTRTVVVLVAFLTLSLSVLAQDTVRLRNGKHVSGTVVIDEKDKDGFRVRRWDAEGEVYVRWSQVEEAEKNRLLGKTAEAASDAGEMIEGIRVLTTTRELVGLLVKEDSSQMQVKTKGSRTPALVPKVAIVKREVVKVPESEAFSAEERVERKGAKAGDKDGAALLEVARFAISLSLRERAREFLSKAAAADPSRKDEIEALVAANEAAIKEGKAEAALAEIRKRVEETEYEKAVELAQKLLSDMADTGTAKKNADLVARLQKEAKEWEVRKAEILAQKVPEAFKARRMALLSECCDSRLKLADARARAAKIDEEVVNDLAKKMKSTPEEILQAWGKREQKVKVVGFGAGTWIVKGGQDGGMDTDAQGERASRAASYDTVTDEEGNTYRVKRAPEMESVALGKKMETSDEWWAGLSRSDRKAWIEAEYAGTSGAIKKVKEETKKCGTCQGSGLMRGTRGGFPVDIKCSRCHGVGEDVVIHYY